MLAGIFLGVETAIPEDVQQAFLDTGTSHIIVISGFNITILAALFAMIFGRLLGRWRGAMAALVAIVLYTILVGADAAVVRVDQECWIHLTTDGEGMWVEVERR